MEDNKVIIPEIMMSYFINYMKNHNIELGSVKFIEDKNVSIEILDENAQKYVESFYESKKEKM